MEEEIKKTGFEDFVLSSQIEVREFCVVKAIEVLNSDFVGLKSVNNMMSVAKVIEKYVTTGGLPERKRGNN